MCKDCRCFAKANHIRGALAYPNAGFCIRHPPTADLYEGWARYPVVDKTVNGCFDGVAKDHAQMVADKLAEI
jgi:hypothetical protein